MRIMPEIEKELWSNRMKEAWKNPEYRASMGVLVWTQEMDDVLRTTAAAAVATGKTTGVWKRFARDMGLSVHHVYQRRKALGLPVRKMSKEKGTV